MKNFLEIRKTALVCIIELLIAGASYSQDPLFSQYYAQPMHINPGFAGISYAPRFEMIYRNQWPLLTSSGASYVTYSISYDQFFKKYNSGIGIQLLADDAGGGLIKSYKLAGTYGYQAQISGDSYLRGGIELGFVQTTYDWAKFIFQDQIDPEYGPISPGGTPYLSSEVKPNQTNPSYLDIGTGLLFYNPYFNIGVSAKHINTPQNDILKINGSSYSGLPIRWVVHGGFQWDLSRSPRMKSIL
jgi:type IX secretion system PorP/SprF family membrane protein